MFIYNFRIGKVNFLLFGKMVIGGVIIGNNIMFFICNIDCGLLCIGVCLSVICFVVRFILRIGFFCV